MTRSLRAELVGSQSPRLSSVPPFQTTASGDDAVDLALSAGLVLDPWQVWSLQMGCSEIGNRWAAFEVAEILARQNGKGAVIEGRELAALFLFGEVLLHSTHHFRTTRGAFNRLVAIIDGSASLRRKIKRITTANGNEGIETMAGGQLAYVARSKGSGRGLSPDVNVIDEAFDYPEAAHTALMPTMSARPNPQIWYTSTPPDEDEHPNSVVLSRLRLRALAGDPGLLWMEWSAGERAELERVLALPAAERKAWLGDRGRWVAANPALGYRLSESFIELELNSMSPRGFAVERLGIGLWPDPDPRDEDDQPAINVDTWTDRRDPASAGLDPVVLGLDATPQRQAFLSAVGWRADGRKHGELIWSGPTSAVIGVLTRVVDQVDPAALVIDGRGVASSLLPEIRAANLEPQVLTSGERSQADDGLVRDVEDDQLRLPGEPMPALDAAAEAATWRKSGDVKFFDRRAGGAPVSPLVSLSLARHGLLQIAATAKPKASPALPAPIPATDRFATTGRDLARAGF